MALILQKQQCCTLISIQYCSASLTVYALNKSSFYITMQNSNIRGTSVYGAHSIFEKTIDFKMHLMICKLW